MTGIYGLTLRASDGRERRMLAWFPTEAIRQDFYEKARRNGISIVKSKKFLDEPSGITERKVNNEK